jgi:hypothetical protein
MRLALGVFALMLTSISLSAWASCPTNAVVSTPFLSLQAGAASGEGDLLLVLLGKDNRTDPAVTLIRYFGSAATDKAQKTAITIDKPILQTTDPSEGHEWSIWRLHLKIDNLPPEGTIQATLAIQDGVFVSEQSIWISNSGRFTSADKARPPNGAVILSDEQPSQFLYSGGSTVASNVAILQGALQDTSKKTLVQGSAFRIGISQFYCLPQHGQELGLAIDVPPNGNLGLVLYVDASNKTIDSGNYTGSLLIGAANQDPILVQVSYAHSSSCAKVIGAVALFVGLIISFICFQGFQNRSAYFQVLLGARQLATRASSIADSIKSGPFQAKLAKTEARLRSIATTLSDDQQLRPNGLPSEFQATMTGISASQLDKLRTYLAGQSLIIDADEYLVGPGAVAISLRTPTASMAQAFNDLDTKGVIVTTVQEAQLFVSQQLPAAPSAQITDSSGKAIQVYSLGPTMAQIPPDRTSLSFREITVQLERTSFLFLLFLGVATWLTGLSILVLSDPAFGGLADYVKCLLWGIGVQGIGQQLGTATVSGVRQSLTIASH